MAGPQNVEFLDISIIVLSRIWGKLPFDLFIKRAEGAYTRIFKKAEQLDQERLEHYRAKKGVDQLYVQKSDLEAYHRMVEHVADEVFKDPKKSTTADILDTI